MCVELLGQAIRVIKWGRETWKDVPALDRGAIFKPTFLRAVQSLRLDALMKVSRNFV